MYGGLLQVYARYVSFRVHQVHFCGGPHACPHEDLAPLMAMIADLKREKDSRQRSQHMVLLYEWSHLDASREASLL